MQEFGKFGDVAVTLGNDFVAVAEIRRPPNNYFDAGLIASLGEAFEALDAEPGCRAAVLTSEGKHFCAGADFRRPDGGLQGRNDRHLYDEAVRLFATRTPVVAAVQGAAIGADSASRCGPTSGSRAPRRVSPPTSRVWPSTTASASA